MTGGQHYWTSWRDDYTRKTSLSYNYYTDVHVHVHTCYIHVYYMERDYRQKSEYDYRVKSQTLIFDFQKSILMKKLDS